MYARIMLAEAFSSREFYFKDWHAYLEQDGKRVMELKIAKTGSDFTYVSMPRETKYPVSSVFEYDSFLEHMAMALSALTLTSLFISLVLGRKALYLRKDSEIVPIME